MPSATEIAAFADSILRSKDIPDYPAALNGLQFDTRVDITKVAAAVDFSARTVAGAERCGAQLLVVHHGAFWQGLRPVVGKRYDIISRLFANAIGVYASHLPLDAHPSLGNNTLLADRLGLTPTSRFASFNGTAIGFTGESTDSLERLIATTSEFTTEHGGSLRLTAHDGGRRIGRWAICTGSGADADTLNEALARGVDTLIVGEGPHWTSVFAEENDMVILYAGHYATETLGVQALAAQIANEFAIDWEFIPAPTGS